MSNVLEVPLPTLPIPERKAYFPETSQSEFLADEVVRRAGDNLAYAIQYGSSVAGDATATSINDVMIIVADSKKFHERNMDLAPSDYAFPRSVAWHTFLNQYGFNFYHSSFDAGEQRQKVKYAVIDADNFVRGCNGSLEEKEKEGTGAFGLYVAGRMQKAALRPLFKGTEEQTEAIEEGINTARIDGVWLALGLQDENFSLDQLLLDYVSLSYKADLRIEKPGKVQTLIAKNRADYIAILDPIITGFIEHGLIARTDDGGFERIQSLSREKVEQRLDKVKWQTARSNYLKNPLTVGLGKGIRYGVAKVQRAREAKHMANSPSVEVFSQGENNPL